MNYDAIIVIAIGTLMMFWIINLGERARNKEPSKTSDNQEPVLQQYYPPYPYGPSPDLMYYMRYRKTMGCLYLLIILMAMLIGGLVYLKYLY